MADTPELIPDEEPAKEVTLEGPFYEEKKEVYYKILPGDSLESIAEQFKTTPEKILERNEISPSDIRFGYWIFI